MKYLFINTVAGFGSTGKIVAKACRELMAQGHECVIAYGRKENLCPDVPTYPICGKVTNAVSFLSARLLDNAGFETRRATSRFLKWVKEYDPDVIWLHNLHGYYIHLGLLFDYLRTCGKEIKWTLHDCWPMTGHCVHFTYVQCDRWKTGCHDCPQKLTYPESFLLDGSFRNYKRKKRSFTGIPNLTLYVPSRWMANLVAESFLKEYPVEVLFNTIDETVFHPTPSDFRREHGLEQKIVILGVASVWMIHKGLDDFCRLAKMLDDRFRIVLVGITPEQEKGLPPEILSLPRTNSATELAGIYSAADLYVSPSTEESFGMTVLEALQCGTKAIVYEETACQEVAETFGGIVVPRGVEHIYEAICKYAEENEL